MAGSFATDSGGAVLTSEEVNSFIVEPLLAESVVLASNPRVFRTSGNPLRIPRLDSLDITSPFVAENAEIPAVDGVWGEVELLPSSLRGMKVLHRSSAELVRHAVGDVGNIMSAALVQRIALAADRAFLLGDGSTGQIRGLAAASGVQTMDAVGSLTLDDLHDAVGLSLAANAKASVWFLNPRDLIALRKVKSTSGEYILQPNPQDALGYTLLGLPVRVTTQIPANGGVGADESTIILADMQQVAVAIDQDLTVAILTETFAQFDQIGVRVTARMDVAPLNPAGIVVLKGVK